MMSANSHSAPGRPIAGLVARALRWLPLILFMVVVWLSHTYVPRPLRTDLYFMGVVILCFAFWMFPSLSRYLPVDEDDWRDDERISPRRRAVIASLLFLFLGALGFSTYMDRVDGRSALVFAVAIALFGLLALALPRNEDAPIDMRPAWLVIAVLFAIFIYLMFSV
jgi:hypothetical protein